MNPARYVCPWCKASLKFPTPVRVGRVVRCPKCSCRFVAPQADLSTPSRSEAAAAAVEGVLVAAPQTPETAPAVSSPSEVLAAAAEAERAGEPVLTLEAISDEPVATAAEVDSPAVPQEPQPQPAPVPTEEGKAGEPVREEGGAAQPAPPSGVEEEKRTEPPGEGPRSRPPGPPVRKPPRWRVQRKPVRPPRKGPVFEEDLGKGWLGLRLAVVVLTVFSCLLTLSLAVLLLQWASSPVTQVFQERVAVIEQNPNLFPQQSWEGPMKMARNLDRVVRLAYILIAVTPIALVGALFSLFGMGKTGGGILLATVPAPLFLYTDFLVVSIGFFAAAVVSFLIGPSRQWDVPTRFVVVFYMLGWGAFGFLCWLLYELVVWPWLMLLRM